MKLFARRSAPEPALEPATILIGGEAVAVAFRRNGRAKRLIVRLDRAGTGVIATLPKRASRKAALDFVNRSSEWIGARLGKRPPPAQLGAAATVPLRGEPHEVIASGGARGAIAVDSAGKVISVPGQAAHVRRRLMDWLKAEARRDLQEASSRYAGLMGASYRRLTVRDQKSRWGSCSAAGDLSYSWRLILAPPHVLDYVAAHEAAHLREMNHGPRFWRLVLTHCRDAARARDWLKRHGAGIHRYQ